RRIPGITGRLELLRAGSLLVAVATHLLLRVPGLARRPLVVGLPMTVAAGGIFGHFLGLQGDLDTPWVHFPHPVAIPTLLPIPPLGWRLAYALSIPASLLAGFALARPMLPPHPMLPPTLAFLVFTTALVVAISHFVNGVVRRGFAQEQLQKATARQ